MEDRKATSEAFLKPDVAGSPAKRIPYIYAGNSSPVDQTFCPKCHTLLIHSHDYQGTQRQEVPEEHP
jgi:hypothetical protein